MGVLQQLETGAGALACRKSLFGQIPRCRWERFKFLPVELLDRGELPAPGDEIVEQDFSMGDEDQAAEKLEMMYCG
jgi:hypothetical protein